MGLRDSVGTNSIVSRVCVTRLERMFPWIQDVDFGGEKRSVRVRFELARIWFEFLEIPIPETAWGSMSCSCTLQQRSTLMWEANQPSPCKSLQIRWLIPVSATPENCGGKKRFDITDKHRTGHPSSATSCIKSIDYRKDQSRSSPHFEYCRTLCRLRFPVLGLIGRSLSTTVLQPVSFVEFVSPINAED